MLSGEKADERLVRTAHRRFAALIDQTQGAGILIDRRVMRRWDLFARDYGWPAVEAYERLLKRAIEDSIGRAATPEVAA